MKIFRKKFNIGLMMMAVIAIAASAFQEPAHRPQPEKPKNLKVLSKNISHEDLIRIMRTFKASLGVECSFCHAQKAGDPKHLDFASDAKPAKDSARMMMRMAMKINKKYFHEKGDFASAKMEISCYTCHHGNQKPPEMPPLKEEDHGHMPPPPPGN